MNNKKSYLTYFFSTAGVAAMFVIVVALYVITGFAKKRMDLTEDKLYTLSQGTRTILNKLDTPIVIRFYCTKSASSMPIMLKTYAQRAEDLLDEMRKNSKGNIEIKKFDPQPDSDAEDSANLDGVEGQMLPTGDKIYLGVALSCLDSKTAIGFLAPEREKLLEYDLARAISQVAHPEKPVIGIMSALPVFGEPMNPMMAQMGRRGQEPWVFISELKKDFNVKQVEMTVDKIDDDIKVLMVIYPKDITEKTEYALDQFVLRGGKLIGFVDSLSLADTRSNNPMNPMQRNINSGASLDKLFKAWGVEFDKNKVAADLRYVTKLNRGDGRVESNPAFLSLSQQAMDTNDVVTSQIDSMIVPFPGSFSGTVADGLKKTVLLKTTTDSQLVEKMMAQYSGEQLSKDFVSSGKEMALAIRLTGKFKTAFPDGKPKDASPDDKKDDKPKTEPVNEAGLKESKSEGVVVLLADSDFLYDQWSVQVANFLGQRIVQLMNGNLPFVQNLVEQMAGDSNLISVRSRATMARPFTVVRDMEKEAEKRFQSKIRELEKRKEDAQRSLNELQSKKEGNQRYILSDEQQKEIQKFREQQASINKELKQERKNLRRDIYSLQTNLKIINIAGMPIIVAFSGIALAIIKRKRTAAK
jgi:ABC-type uncharacterized transport system involved in gliding motility auxiliary subunit